MFLRHQLINGWRVLQRSFASEMSAGNCSVGMRRGFSDVTGGKVDKLAADTATTSRLFENVRMPLQEAGAAAGASAGAADAARMSGLERTPAGRALSILGSSLFYGALGTTGLVGYYTYRYDADELQHIVEETQKEKNAFPGSPLWVKVVGWYVEKRRLIELEMKKYADPPSDHLLPDLPPPHRHIKTLVLDLDDVLVHSDWTRGRGWRTFKRPGAEDFIRDMSQYYELVVFTSQLPTYADPILDRLDPQRLVQYRLYRDSTQYVNGKHVRDLSKLNRDLKQVLLITADPHAFALQPDNAIKLPKWTSTEGSDTTLLDLLPFLEAVVRTSVSDVRDVVRSYEGQDIPTAFRERMARVQQAKANRQGPRGFLGGIAR